VKRKKNILAAFVVASLLSLSLRTSPPIFAANSNGDKSESSITSKPTAFDYGVDTDGIPFVRKADGTKGKYLSVSTQHFKLQISKEAVIGDVEFLRLSRAETVTTFLTFEGDSFGVRKKIQPPTVGKLPNAVVTFEFGKEKVTFEPQAARRQESLSSDVGERLQRVLVGLRANGTLKKLMEEASFFLSNAVTSKVFPAFRVILSDDSSAFDCAKQAVMCLSAVAAYIASIGSLIAACPETVGLSCVGALLAHPLFGAMVAFSCSEVIKKCEVKKPVSEYQDDLELLWY